MKNQTLLSIFILVISLNNCYPQEKPKLPYISKDQCPFEGCVYTEWTTRKDLVVYKSEGDTSIVAFKLKQNESFDALTGNVHIYNCGIVVVLKPFELSNPYDSCSHCKIDVKPEDKIYLLHDIGEGWYMGWFKGKIYEIPGDLWNYASVNEPSENSYAQKLVEPVYDWWVKIRDKQNRIGWILINNNVEVDGADSLGKLEELPNQQLKATAIDIVAFDRLSAFVVNINCSLNVMNKINL
ncbi:MAG: hypothetical protein A2V66_15240 [Ignavibacteria bacterium RBG_13_36_8]|nr:MAG: hypothetical protein A2V66_15240 [Ignavibacteria bacterium RBG_13_36_8]